MIGTAFKVSAALCSRVVREGKGLVVGGKDAAEVKAETRDDVDEKTSWLLYSCLVPVISPTEFGLYASRHRVAKIGERSRTRWPYCHEISANAIK